MSRIRKFNENINSESFLDIIKHETYVLNDLKSTGIIKDLKYTILYFNNENDYHYALNYNYVRIGVSVQIKVGNRYKIDFENLAYLTKELNHIKDKLKLDYDISPLNVYHTTIEVGTEHLAMQFNIVQERKSENE